jgi:hypothetical protein
METEILSMRGNLLVAGVSNGQMPSLGEHLK